MIAVLVNPEQSKSITVDDTPVPIGAMLGLSL